ncbi:DNA-binding protein [Actinosynnema sp. ALI-1.44]|uniref:helix-turn-helix domain-containing protein n=1 Tax=Actinosynnema sp. ALI-1.44 TaxID=1933779 RepID=UPI00097BCC55|nr:helix-turn-helix transcriptional regulator [Actinosynnema sp. ALI-1.44]ONI70281.1 DNA-binding protein [Actinosynnema sp. ALI-1.44]
MLRPSQDDRRRLGAELRHLRDQAGRTLDEVAARLECSSAKVSRIETGQVAVRPIDLRELLDYYDVSGAQRTVLLAVVRHGKQRWWRDYADVIYPGYDLYVGYEDEATEILEYQPQWIPGLLQTHAYAQALGEAFGRPSEVARRWADLRMARQAILVRDTPPSLSVVLDDSVLHRVAAVPRLAAEQLRHLMTVGSSVRIQVLPASVGLHAGQAGGFIALRFAGADDVPVAYTNNLTEGHLIRDGVNEYLSVFDKLRQDALSPEDSLAFVEGLLP